MASSKRETILQALVDLIQAVGVTVYRSPQQAIERTAENVNACVIDWSDESAEPLTYDADECLLLVGVSMMSRAVTDAELMADELMVDAHALIMADRTLGGLSQNLMRQGASRGGDDAELETVVIKQNYVIEYRHNSADLTT